MNKGVIGIKGKAGSGKSYLLKKILRQTDKDIIMFGNKFGDFKELDNNIEFVEIDEMFQQKFKTVLELNKGKIIVLIDAPLSLMAEIDKELITENRNLIIIDSQAIPKSIYVDLVFENTGQRGKFIVNGLIEIAIEEEENLRSRKFETMKKEWQKMEKDKKMLEEITRKLSDRFKGYNIRFCDYTIYANDINNFNEESYVFRFNKDTDLEKHKEKICDLITSTLSYKALNLFDMDFK